MRESRWFKRGWTLQELIAPRQMLFYDKSWNFLGSKYDLLKMLNGITRIDLDVLQDGSQILRKSVAKRMSWAAHRSTSREEDQAYRLLGIFDVNMPMLYGEGSKAFERLQVEIIRSGSFADHSILAWTSYWRSDPRDTLVSSRRQQMHNNFPSHEYLSPLDKLLSPSSYGLRHAHNIISWDSAQSQLFEWSRKGLELTAYVQLPEDQTVDGVEHRYLIDYDLPVTVALNCRYADEPMTRIALQMKTQSLIEEFRFLEEQRPINYGNVLLERFSFGPEEGGRFRSVKASEQDGYSRENVTLARTLFSGRPQ